MVFEERNLEIALENEGWGVQWPVKKPKQTKHQIKNQTNKNKNQSPGQDWGGPWTVDLVQGFSFLLVCIVMVFSHYVFLVFFVL